MRPHELQPVLDRINEKDIQGDIIAFGIGRDEDELDTLLGFCKDRGCSLYMIDSFKGLPEPENEEDRTPNEKDKGRHEWGETEYHRGQFCKPLMEVMSHIAKQNIDWFNHAFIVPGWFKDTLPDLQHDEPDNIYAGCLIDVDYLSSMKIVLEYMNGKLHKNGIIACHECLQLETVNIMADNYKLLRDNEGELVINTSAFYTIPEYQ